MNTQIPTIAKWENKDRWYQAELICDLLGDWVLTCRWGSKHTKHHGMKREIVEDKSEGYLLLNKIDACRKKRKTPYWRIY